MSAAPAWLTLFKPLAALMAHPWAYPALEVAHLVGVAALFGSLLLLDLRGWGRATDIDLNALTRLAVRVALSGFVLAAVTGLFMFATQPAELWNNAALRWKLVLIAAAGLNAAVFHWRGRRRAAPSPDRFGALQHLLSLGIWLGVIICGRWIAYV